VCVCVYVCMYVCMYVGEIFFFTNRKGGKTVLGASKGQIFFQTTGKVKRYPNPGSSGQMDKNGPRFAFICSSLDKKIEPTEV